LRAAAPTEQSGGEDGGGAAYLLDVGDDAVVGQLLAESVGDVEDVHEPPAVRRDVGLVDGEVEVGEHLDGLEQHPSLPGAVDLNERGRRAHRIVDDHPRRVHPDHQLLVLVEPLHLLPPPLPPPPQNAKNLQSGRRFRARTEPGHPRRGI
jgi:hypothetical protein